MRKILSVLLSVLLCVLLCGCSLKARGRQKGLEAIVSSVGFDCIDDRIFMYIETVGVNSEDSEADRKLILTEGSGKNLAVAYEQANKNSVRPFMFSHCAVAVIGENVTAKRMREICRFLYNKDEINLSLRFIYTKSAKELLSCDTVGSVTVGYDLSDALEKLTDYSGTDFENRFYEVESARKNAVNIFSLPRFRVEEKSYSADGSVIFKNDEPVMILDSSQTQILAFLTDNQKKGQILFNNRAYAVDSVKVKHRFSFDERLKTSLTVNLKLSGDENPKQQIAEEIKELFISSKLKGADIFMLGNKIEKKERKLWSKIEHGYYSIYKNSQLAVTVK